MAGFKHAALEELTDQQVRYAPAARRTEQLARAEALRAQAADLRSEALAQLRKALLIRAAELDLTADVLLEPAPPRPHLQAIA